MRRRSVSVVKVSLRRYRLKMVIELLFLALKRLELQRTSSSKGKRLKSRNNAIRLRRGRLVRNRNNRHRSRRKTV
jgi:hypothetical protein